MQIFEYPIFGLHMGITLFGSKEAKDVIMKYASKLKVSVEILAYKKKRKKQVQSDSLFVFKAGKYIYGKSKLAIKENEVYKNIINNILACLIKELDNIDHHIVLEFEMVSNKDAKKMEHIILKLTHAHRALIE